MYAYFWRFEKKINSTKQPDDMESTPITIHIKSGCSVVNPVIEVVKIGDVEPYNFNYAFIEKFSRYYFVNDWTFDNGIWSCSLSVDVLASYRDIILNSKQYVSRGDVANSASAILDTAPLTLATSERETNTGSTIFSSEYTSGFFIVGIIGPSSTMGAVNYYYFSTASELATLTSKLMDNVDWLDITDISTELTKCLVNPMQYIVSCKFFPFSISVTYDTTNIKMGYWDTGISGKRLKVYNATKSGTVTIPKHPQSGSLGNFTNLPPYSTYTFEFEPFGAFPLDGVKLADLTSIQQEILVDLVTGEATMTLFGDDDTFVSKQFARVCVDLPLATATSGLLGVAAGIAGTAIGDFARNHGAGDLANAITGVSNVVVGASSGVAVKGSQTSRAFMTSPAKLHGHFQRISPYYTDILGKAVCMTVQLGTQTGYNICVKPRITIPGTRGEQESIVQFLEGGFFVE